MSKVLSLAMRPNTIEDFIGSEEIIKNLKNQFESKRIPHFFIISGKTGSGKTTLSRILSRMFVEPIIFYSFFNNIPI